MLSTMPMEGFRIYQAAFENRTDARLSSSVTLAQVGSDTEDKSLTSTIQSLIPQWPLAQYGLHTHCAVSRLVQ